jgi:hypothetical protein
VEQDFAPAAERHSGRRADNREGRVLERLVGELPALDELLDLGERGDVEREQREAEVGTGGEVRTLVVDDQRLVFPNSGNAASRLFRGNALRSATIWACNASISSFAARKFALASPFTARTPSAGFVASIALAI